MIRTLTTAIAYWKAPKRTYAARHPVKAMKLGALLWVGRRLTR